MDFRPNPGHTRGGHEPKKPHQPEHSGFGALGLRPELLRAVEKLGWASPSPIQHDAIPHVLAGHDLIAIAQTGTGKTGAFALPLLQLISQLPPAKPLHPYCVILAPTRELVQQIDAQFKAIGGGTRVRSMTIFGGVSDRPQISQLNAGVEIVCAAPGRLLDLLGQGWVHFEQVAHCVLDEADRMFDMGFILDLKRILNRMPSRRQTLLFSATMPPEIQALAAEFLYKPREVRMGAVAPPQELTHELWEMDAEQKNTALDRLLREDWDSVLIFTRTKHRADSVARRLQREGERVAVLHSNKSQNQRDLALARFKGGQARVLVATDVASRGLDIEGIGLVVNYDTPRDPDDYVHRVGRTARAKRPGKAVTLVTIDEFKYVKKIEGLIKQRITRRSEGLPKVERDPNMPPPDRPRSERPGRGERGVRPASAGPGQVHGSRGSRGGHAPDDAPPKLTRSQRKARNEQQRAQAGAPGAPPPAEPPSNPRHGSSGGTTRGSQGPRRGGSGGSGGAGRSGGPGSGGRVRASGGRDYGYTD